MKKVTIFSLVILFIFLFKVDVKAEDFSTKNIIVVCDEKEKPEGNYSSSEYYIDHYILKYETEEATKIDYEKLIEEYNKDCVLLDSSVSAEAVSWGTSYLNLDTKGKQLSNKSTVKVAVLDTGINKNHKIFEGTTILPGYNVITKSSDVTDTSGHGTAVAGVIAESTPSNVQILPVKVMRSNEAGSLEDVLKGIAWACNNGADVINISLGSPLKNNDAYFKYFNAIVARYKKVIIAAAGNENCNIDVELMTPAACDSVVSVGSIDKNGIRVNGSNYGGSLDFVGPGKGIRCAYSSSGNTYSTATGSSFSTPHVSSIAALILSENKNLSKEQVYQKLKELSKDLGAAGKDDYYGYGMPMFKASQSNSNTQSSTNEVKLTGWQKINGIWYYYKNNGVKAVNEWQKDSKGWRYLGSDGKMVYSRWILDKNVWYYLDSNGYMSKNTWAKDSKGYMWLGSDGRIVKNVWKKFNNNWYYLKSNGYRATNEWVKINNKWYYFLQNSVMKTGWLKWRNSWYYLNPSGDMAIGWKKISNKWYYMNSSGAMQTGWIKLSGKWYYLDGNGVMKTGWLKWSKKWYYLNSNGVMQTGNKKIGRKTYKFNSSGVCLNP